MLLTTSPATVRRDARQLRKDGKVVMARGKTNHSENSVRRYLRDFVQVIALHCQRFSLAQIRQVTGFSERLIREYLDLHADYDRQECDRLALLLEPASPEEGGSMEKRP